MKALICLTMKNILVKIKKGNPSLHRVLKYFFHTYFLIALICLMVCHVTHELGMGTVEHIVIKGRPGIQSVLHKIEKKTTSLNPVLYFFQELDNIARTNQNIFKYSSKELKPSISFVATTRLIL